MPKLDAVVNMFDSEIQVPYLVTPLAVIGGSTLSSSAVSFQPDEITLGSGYTASGFAGLHVMDNSANDWFFGFNDAEGAWMVDHGSGTLIAGSIAVGYGDRAYLSYDGSGNLGISDTLSGSPNLSIGSGQLKVGGVIKGQRQLANGTFTLSSTDYYLQMSCNTANLLINLLPSALS